MTKSTHQHLNEKFEKERQLNHLKDQYKSNAERYNESFDPNATVLSANMQQWQERLKNAIQEITQLEQELYGKEAAKPNSPNILEKHHRFSAR